MKIEPIFTLQIEDDRFINAETEVSITAERCVDGYAVQVFTGLFKSCSEEGLYLEVGEKESNILYIEFEEIVEIEEV
jgi:hypothetical protein